MTIKTADIRIRCASRPDADAARNALINAIGHSRLALATPKAGRGESDGHTPYFIYGTLQFDVEEEERAVGEVAAVTGKTTRLRRKP